MTRGGGRRGGAGGGGGEEQGGGGGEEQASACFRCFAGLKLAAAAHPQWARGAQRWNRISVVIRQSSLKQAQTPQSRSVAADQVDHPPQLYDSLYWLPVMFLSRLQLSRLAPPASTRENTGSE